MFANADAAFISENITYIAPPKAWPRLFVNTSTNPLLPSHAAKMDQEIIFAQTVGYPKK